MSIIKIPRNHHRCTAAKHCNVYVCVRILYFPETRKSDSRTDGERTTDLRGGVPVFVAGEIRGGGSSSYYFTHTYKVA